MNETEFHAWMWDEMLNLYPKDYDPRGTARHMMRATQDGFVAGAIAAYEELKKRG